MVLVIWRPRLQRRHLSRDRLHRLLIHLLHQSRSHPFCGQDEFRWRHAILGRQVVVQYVGIGLMGADRRVRHHVLAVVLRRPEYCPVGLGSARRVVARRVGLAAEEVDYVTRHLAEIAATSIPRREGYTLGGAPHLGAQRYPLVGRLTGPRELGARRCPPVGHIIRHHSGPGRHLAGKALTRCWDGQHSAATSSQRTVSCAAQPSSPVQSAPLPKRAVAPPKVTLPCAGRNTHFGR
mmetsp:Transcript_19738/g.62793  ORF Transcript_19738/g.62793 Transcript_19738/m.62793 type:complete len:236 (-) Transcript_19738:273-980(-)